MPTDPAGQEAPPPTDAREPAPRLDRRAAVLTAACAGLGLALLAAVAVPWDWVPGADLVPAEPEDHFTSAEIARAESYASLARTLSWSALGLSLVVAGVLGFTGLGSLLVGRLRRLPWWLQAALGVLLVLLLERLVTLPLALALRDRRLQEDLTRQELGPWFVDVLLSRLVEWGVLGALVVLLLATARRWSRRWFAPAAAAGAALTFLISYGWPVVVEPLFNDFTPLADARLEREVRQLAEAQGVEVGEVLVADASRRTTTLNAYVSGIGSTRRVVLYDTLVDDVSREEALTVVAHELAHAQHRDVLVGTSMAALGTVLGIALLALVLDSRRLQRRSRAAGPGDPRVVPLVLALVSISAVVVAPVQNAISRAVEARADRVGLATYDDPAAFEQMQVTLARRSLADPTPPAWSYWWGASHPTVLQRLGLPAALDRAEEAGAR